MSISDDIEGRLSRDGYLIKEDLLPDDVFERHRVAVRQSWADGAGWATQFRVENEVRVLKRQIDSEVSHVSDLIRRRRGEHDFQYLYHVLSRKEDRRGLISTVVRDVRLAWREEIGLLASSSTDERFSLTAFTPGCFLDPHNDYSGVQDRYRVTLLLYFGSDGGDGSGGLVFNFRERKRTIRASRNVGVLFVPSQETEHWVERIPCGVGTRLALSGWLM